MVLDGNAVRSVNRAAALLLALGESQGEAGVTELARRLGVKTRWINSAFDGIFPALLANRFDIVISITTITPERQKNLDFSTSYYDSKQSLLVPVDSDIESIDDRHHQVQDDDVGRLELGL